MPTRDELSEVMEFAAREARAYLREVDTRRVRQPHAAAAAQPPVPSKSFVARERFHTDERLAVHSE